MRYDTLPTDVFKSVGSFIQTFLQTRVAIPFFFEEGRVDELGPNTVEIRFDGPDVDEIANSQYWVSLDVDLLVTSKITSNIFERQNLLGICQEALREDIPLVVGGSIVGAFSTAKPFGGTEKIVVTNYGPVHKDRQVLHTSVYTKLHILI